MRLDAVLDSVYVLGSLWGALSAPRVCTSSSAAGPRPVPEAIRTSGPPAVTAFVGVNVIPMDQERVLANHTVLVEGGRITALGPVAEVQVPTGAVQVDGRGKYLIPGLADMHEHGRIGKTGVSVDDVTNSVLRFTTAGVTTVRYLNVADSLFERSKHAETRGWPHIYVVGSGAGAREKAAGHRVVRPSRRDSAARRLGLMVAAHDHDLSFGEALALGAAGGSVEHVEWLRDTLTGFKWQRFGPLSPREAESRMTQLPALAAAAARAGLWVTPTLHCTVDSYSVPPVHAMLLQRITKALQEAGVKLLLAGDDGYTVHDELATLVRAGLTPYQALRTGTYNPAEYFGLLDSAGTVAVGKRADLVLLNGNPLQDIRYTREPAGVMLHGRWLDRAELDRQLLLIYKSYGRSAGNEDGRFSWFRSGLLSGNIMQERDPPVDTTIAALMAWQRTQTEPNRKFKARMATFEALSDSLAAAAAPGSSAAAQRLRRQLAAELGAMRVTLPPEKHAAFDAVARLWLREQARQGHPTTVPGVAPTL